MIELLVYLYATPALLLYRFVHWTSAGNLGVVKMWKLGVLATAMYGVAAYLMLR